MSAGHFDFNGHYPRWEDADERLYENRVRAEGFNDIVERLMACDGLDRDEAETRALLELACHDPADCACGRCAA